jgi:hypothetical protein
MLVCFFDSKGIITNLFFQSTTKHSTFTFWMFMAAHLSADAKVDFASWQFLPTVLMVQKKEVPVFVHPLHSPTLVPCDVLCF